MPWNTRPILLTPDLVARVPPGVIPEDAPRQMLPVTDEIIEAESRAVLAGHPPGEDLHVFAFGSLIWNPGFEHIDDGVAVARGWHRAFRMRIAGHRGTPDRPGLMMGLDRGGTCRGLVLRIERQRVEDEVRRLIRRELPVYRPGKPHPHRAEWIRIETDSGPRRAVAFVLDRRSPIYSGALELPETALVLATASGPGGSCAEYLMLTVSHLAARGIVDRNLWRLQAMVAEHLGAAPPPG